MNNENLFSRERYLARTDSIRLELLDPVIRNAYATRVYGNRSLTEVYGNLTLIQDPTGREQQLQELFIWDIIDGEHEGPFSQVELDNAYKQVCHDIGHIATLEAA